MAPVGGTARAEGSPMNSTDDAVTGIPYSPETRQVDEWSRAIYENLRDWAESLQGKWERWEPGYLLLTLTSDGEAEVDPILLYTADEELTVTFGYWETHLPEGGSSAEDDDEIAADEARGIVEDWLAGRMLTAIYFDKDGQWCGSLSAEPGDLPNRLQGGREWIANSQPSRIEVRSPRQRDWRHFDIDGSQIVEVTASR
jgi:hypothetical protein